MDGEAADRRGPTIRRGRKWPAMDTRSFQVDQTGSVDLGLFIPKISLFLGKKQEDRFAIRQPSGNFPRPRRDPPVWPNAQPAGALGLA